VTVRGGLVTLDPADKRANAFVRFVLGPGGQAILEAQGFSRP